MNFVYEFSTFIELGDQTGIVIIEDSNFKRISNCGSIINNNLKYVSNEDFNYMRIGDWDATDQYFHLESLETPIY